MTLEEKKREYQKILAVEYQKCHIEETEGLTLEEVALMNPLTEFDFKVFLAHELMELTLSIDEVQAEIDYNLEKINDPKTFHQDASECRSENALLKKELEDLRKEYDELRRLIPERKNKNERSR